MTEKMEDLLNGGYGGLYGEVVDEDTYKLKEIKFKPDVVIDIGANVGIFARYSRELFPDALIICVEPDVDNFKNLIHFTPSNNIVFINKAIGQGVIYRTPDAPNGAHESYVSEGMGFDNSDLNKLSKIGTECIMIDEIIKTYVKEGYRVILKIDCEGAENLIFAHKESMDAMKFIDYIVIELHFCVSINNHSLIKQMTETNIIGTLALTKTHNCDYDHIYFYATKK